MQVIVDLCVVPLGVGVSVSKYVAECQRVLTAAGLEPRLHAYGTNVEGEWDEVLELIKKCHFAIREDTDRVSTSIKIDDRKGASDALSRKIKSVEEKVGKELEK